MSELSQHINARLSRMENYNCGPPDAGMLEDWMRRAYSEEQEGVRLDTELKAALAEVARLREREAQWEDTAIALGNELQSIAVSGVIPALRGCDCWLSWAGAPEPLEVE